MSLVGFKPTIPMFKRVKTFHALDRAATVIGRTKYRQVQIGCLMKQVQIISLLLLYNL
jgi:hypothetical protein